MAPKKANNVNEASQDLEDIKATLSDLSKDLTTVTQQQATILQQQAKLMVLMDEVKDLREALKEKEKVIHGLEKRVDELEQYTRMEDVIISGLETKHRSYARVVANTTSTAAVDVPDEEQLSLERQVVTFFSTKDIKIDPNDISACHLLTRRHGNAKPMIVVRFVNRRHKVELLRQARKLKGSGVFVNEHLTYKNADIARQARIIWKQRKIQATWTRNGRVFIRLNGTPEQAKVILVKEATDLDQYK